MIQFSKYQYAPKESITLIRAGEKAQHQLIRRAFATAHDWQLRVDLERQLKFPKNIATSFLCPDMVLTSESTKHVVLLELIIPWEDQIEVANKHKRAK